MLSKIAVRHSSVVVRTRKLRPQPQRVAVAIHSILYLSTS